MLNKVRHEKTCRYYTCDGDGDGDDDFEALLGANLRNSVGRQIPITQILPEYLICQAYMSTVSERSYITGTYLTYFAQVPEWSI
jgi:hypothetical protein